MNYTEAEAVFVAAVRDQFSFLVTQHGFTEVPATWDGKGITISYSHPALDVSNYLEADEVYLTWIKPRRKAPVQSFDEEWDEPLAAFELADLLSDDDARSDVSEWRFSNARDLEHAISRRSALIRENMSALLSPDQGWVALVGERVKLRRLEKLVADWAAFVNEVAAGYDKSIAKYVAGVNVRGQLKSVLKWPGKADPELLDQLRVLDDRFDRLTTPIAFAHRPGIYPHPRAKRWWRIPEDPRGRLREFLFRPAEDA